MSSTIKYKGATIATAENATKTLQTSGKYLEGDIEVTDVSSGGNLQAKTGITPTTASQTVTPDSGYDGLSSVQIDAMPAGSYGTPTWSHYITQGSRLLIHPTFPDFDDGYMASAPNSNDTLTLETQTITPSDSQQVVTPTDLNHYLQRVTVNPITYSASDEGKVVSNGALVAQTSETITENGTYDTTLNDEVVVNVSGGGGGVSDLAKLCNGTLTRLDDDGITSVNSQLIRGLSTNLATVFLKNLTYINTGYAFSSPALVTAVFPAIQSTSNAGFYFSGATKLAAVDFGPDFSTEIQGVRSNLFNGASNMNVLILRKTSLVALQGINAFNNTPFASGKAGGTLYVPSALISSYQSATNWSTILGYENNQILPIEGSIYETQYADGTPIT